MDMDLPHQIHHKSPANNSNDENDVESNQINCSDTISTLPKSKGWMSDFLYNYQGVWVTMAGLQGLISVQQNYKPFPSDILLVTLPKSGTTWLKALVFSILNRGKFDAKSHPLFQLGPHDCVVFLESIMTQKNAYSGLDSEVASSPRIFATHIPYPCLPESVKASECKIVYLFRDPKDVLVSSWYYMNKLRGQKLPPLTIEEAFEMFIQGISNFGPFWDHLLGYYGASLHSHNNIKFLSYQALKLKPYNPVKGLAQFLGCPFSIEEEMGGVVEEIIRICGFENLSNLEVNRTGVQHFSSKFVVENRNFFRKGQVGDFKNHLSDEMIVRLDQLVQEKLSHTSLI